MQSDVERVLAAINDSIYIWRPAEKLSKETGLPVKQVREILETNPSVVRSPNRNRQGLILYSTREHLVHLSSASVRYLGTQPSS
jgi:hypothetical protein